MPREIFCRWYINQGGPEFFFTEEGDKDGKSYIKRTITKEEAIDTLNVLDKVFDTGDINHLSVMDAAVIFKALTALAGEE